MHRVFVIGGPNGAGKTTSSRALLPDTADCDEFVNADAIAVGLSPFHPERVALRAGRLMLERLDELVAAKRDFAFESTLSTRSFAPFLRRCQAAGYEVELLFVWLHSAEMAIERVALRVRAGGHNVPTEDVRRRYGRSRRNLLELYMPLANRWTVCDNSDDNFHVLARRAPGRGVEVGDERGWVNFTSIAGDEDENDRPSA